MTRPRNPPDQEADPVAGLRQRRAEHELPTGPIQREDVGDGQSRLLVKDEVERLKAMSTDELREEARALGVEDAKIERAVGWGPDRIRLAILEVKIAEAMS